MLAQNVPRRDSPTTRAKNLISLEWLCRSYMQVKYPNLKIIIITKCYTYTLNAADST